MSFSLCRDGEDQDLVVFLFGNKGSGKTTILAGLFLYYLLTQSSNGARRSKISAVVGLDEPTRQWLKHNAKSLLKGEWIPQTNILQVLRIRIKFGGVSIRVTTVDYPGEHFTKALENLDKEILEELHTDSSNADVRLVLLDPDCDLLRLVKVPSDVLAKTLEQNHAVVQAIGEVARKRALETVGSSYPKSDISRVEKSRRSPLGRDVVNIAIISKADMIIDLLADSAQDEMHSPARKALNGMRDEIDESLALASRFRDAVADKLTPGKVRPKAGGLVSDGHDEPAHLLSSEAALNFLTEHRPWLVEQLRSGSDYFGCFAISSVGRTLLREGSNGMPQVVPAPDIEHLPFGYEELFEYISSLNRLRRSRLVRRCTAGVMVVLALALGTFTYIDYLKSQDFTRTLDEPSMANWEKIQRTRVFPVLFRGNLPQRRCPVVRQEVEELEEKIPSATKPDQVRNYAMRIDALTDDSIAPDDLNRRAGRLANILVSRKADLLSKRLADLENRTAAISQPADLPKLVDIQGSLVQAERDYPDTLKDRVQAVYQALDKKPHEVFQARVVICKTTVDEAKTLDDFPEVVRTNYGRLWEDSEKYLPKESGLTGILGLEVEQLHEHLCRKLRGLFEAEHPCLARSVNSQATLDSLTKANEAMRSLEGNLFTGPIGPKVRDVLGNQVNQLRRLLLDRVTVVFRDRIGELGGQQQEPEATTNLLKNFTAFVEQMRNLELDQDIKSLCNKTLNELKSAADLHQTRCLVLELKALKEKTLRTDTIANLEGLVNELQRTLESSWAETLDNDGSVKREVMSVRSALNQQIVRLLRDPISDEIRKAASVLKLRDIDDKIAEIITKPPLIAQRAKVVEDIELRGLADELRKQLMSQLKAKFSEMPDEERKEGLTFARALAGEGCVDASLFVDVRFREERERVLGTKVPNDADSLKDKRAALNRLIVFHRPELEKQGELEDMQSAADLAEMWSERRKYRVTLRESGGFLDEYKHEVRLWVGTPSWQCVLNSSFQVFLY
jgi:adenylate kinase family enzyme